MFPSHRLDHPKVDNSIYLEGWSYVWGSLFGPFYVLYHGFGWRALAMFGISLAIGAATAGIILAIAIVQDAPEVLIPVAVVLPIIALIVQGAVAIQIVLLGYFTRGWREGY